MHTKFILMSHEYATFVLEYSIKVPSSRLCIEES